MDLSKISSITKGKVKLTGISDFSELELKKVYPNPNQPRKQFEDIEGLALTIKKHGLLQPITVAKKEDGYMIISGERRYKAHLHNGSKTIKAYILNAGDEAIEELTLIENIQRDDLTDLEISKHIVKLWESGRYKRKSDLAKTIGKSSSYISKAFSTLKLDDDLIKKVERSKKPIPLSVLDELSRLKDKESQKDALQSYQQKKITRDEIKNYKDNSGAIKQIFPREIPDASSIEQLEEFLWELKDRAKEKYKKHSSMFFNPQRAAGLDRAYIEFGRLQLIEEIFSFLNELNSPQAP